MWYREIVMAEKARLRAASVEWSKHLDVLEGSDSSTSKRGSVSEARLRRVGGPSRSALKESELQASSS